MQSPTNIYQLTGRVWLYSIGLSSILVSYKLFFHEVIDDHSENLLYQFFHSKNLFQLPIIMLFSTILHLVCGLPALFLCYIGFNQLKKANYPEHFVRPLMVVFAMAIVSGTTLFLFQSESQYLFETNMIPIMLFATTFILMTEDELVQAISFNE